MRPVIKMKPVNLFSLSLPLITFLIASYHQVSSQSLPHITISPSVNTAVPPEGTIRLDCTTNSTSNVSYQWMKNGNIVSPTSKISILSNSSLLISEFTDSEHNGNYSCNVTDGNWTLTSHSVLVLVAYVESDNNGQTLQKDVSMNNYTVIPCIPSYTGYPLREIEPFFTAFDLADSNTATAYLPVGGVSPENNAIVGANGDLYLRKVTVSRKYICQLRNGVSQNFRVHTTVVNVVGSISEPAPTPLAVPTDLTVAEGDIASMNCIASGSLSVVNMTGPDGAVISNGIKLINSVSSSDGGSYSCDITGTPGTYTGTLTIKHSPSITVHPPSSVNINYGNPLTLSCSATGSDIVWIWYHNGIKISDSSTVTVSTAELQDSGAYQCFATNEAGVDSRNTLVNVKTIPPSFTNNGRLSNILGFARESLTLHCNVTGAPVPSYQWKKEDTVLSPISSEFTFPSPGMLVFNSLNSVLQGTYTCIAKSMIDTDTVIGIVNSTAQVYVAEPTIINSIHMPSIIVYNGESFVLNCSVTHDTNKTRIALSWTLNGTIIANNVHTQLIQSADQSELSLRVMGADSRDFGHYQCEAITSYITNGLSAPVVYSGRTSIIVTDAPVKPLVTNVSSFYSTVLEVKWIYNGFPANVESFRIEIQNSTSDIWYPSKPNIAIPANGVTRANIVELEPYSYYQIRVVVNLTEGREVYSDPYGPVRTAQGVPGLPPQGLRAVSRSKTDITLFWDPPALTARYGIITDYTVSYWISSTGSVPLQSSSIINQTLGSNVTTHVLSRLTGGNTYWIRIAAHNSAGMGPFSSPINATTDTNTGGTGEGSGEAIHRKTWFIFLLCFVALILIILVVACIATVRWKSNRKGHKYPVGGSFRGEEVVDFSRDVVYDYEKRRKPLEPLSTIFSDDEARESESSQATLPQSMTHAMYGGPATDSVIRRAIPLPPLPGYAVPPSYINPPSFEDSMKQRLNKRRSASMSFLERAEHMNLGSSGWSVGHDPKAGFLMYEDVDTDSVDKTHLHHIHDDISGGSSDSRLQSNPLATRSGSLATFV